MCPDPPKLPEQSISRRRDGREALRRIALLSADLGIAPSLDWVIERVAEHGCPYDEFNAEHWLHDIHGVIQLLRPTARRKKSSFRGDVLLASAIAHTFQHRDVARTLERWRHESPDNVHTLR